MFRLNINSQIHGIRSRDFKSQEELSAQLDLWNSAKHWGEHAPYWVRSETPIAGALETRITPVDVAIGETPRSYTEYLMPATVTYSTQDVTGIVKAEKDKAKRLARIAWADGLFAELANENAKDISLGLNTLANVVAAEKKLQDIQTSMQSSSFELALLKYQALDLPELSAQRKADFIGKIQAYLAAEI